jgi:hypothetical protein
MSSKSLFLKNDIFPELKTPSGFFETKFYWMVYWIKLASSHEGISFDEIIIDLISIVSFSSMLKFELFAIHCFFNIPLVKWQCKGKHKKKRLEIVLMFQTLLDITLNYFFLRSF